MAPFEREEAEEFLTALLGESVGATGQSPLHDLKQLILEKTQGTPFFMEEIVQELFEQGILVRDGVETHCSASLPTDLHLPPTVQGILASRIDRLAPKEKALLQQLAVIGREFPLSLVRQVLPQSEDELYRLLASLQHKEFLYEQPAFPEVEYIFKHALTQEVAYGTVLQEQRKLLHERTGQALEALYAATLHEHYDDLAHHYRRSANTEKAIIYLHFFAAPEVGKAYTRARELCQQVGEPSQLFPVLYGLWAFYVTGGDLKAARELGEQLLSFAQRTQDSTLLLEAHRALGETFFWRGEFVAAREYTEQGIALYDSRRHRSLAFLYAEDPGVVCRVFAAYVLWLLGYPNQALKRIHEALTLAQGLSHPHSLAVALASVAWLHQFRREGQLTQQQAEATVALSAEQGFPF